MMNYLYSLGGIAAALYMAYVMLRGRKSDQVLAELSRKDRTKEAQELGALTQEVKDAKLDYKESRARYDAIMAERAKGPGPK